MVESRHKTSSTLSDEAQLCQSQRGRHRTGHSVSLTPAQNTNTNLASINYPRTTHVVPFVCLFFVSMLCLRLGVQKRKKRKCECFHVKKRQREWKKLFFLLKRKKSKKKKKKERMKKEKKRTTPDCISTFILVLPSTKAKMREHIRPPGASCPWSASRPRPSGRGS